jgi:hypothetical protein
MGSQTCVFFRLSDDEVVNAKGLTPSLPVDRVEEDAEAGSDGCQVTQMEGGRVARGIVPHLGRVTLEYFENKVLGKTSVMTLVTTQFHRLTCLVKYGTVGHGGWFLWKRTNNMLCYLFPSTHTHSPQLTHKVGMGLFLFPRRKYNSQLGRRWSLPTYTYVSSFDTLSIDLFRTLLLCPNTLFTRYITLRMGSRSTF